MNTLYHLVNKKVPSCEAYKAFVDSLVKIALIEKENQILGLQTLNRSLGVQNIINILNNGLSTSENNT